MPTQTDNDAAEAIAEILAEIGVTGALTIEAGAYDVYDGNVNANSKSTSVLMSPPLKDETKLKSDEVFSDGFSEGESRESSFVVYLDASALRSLGIHDVPLQSSVSVSNRSGSVVKVGRIISGELIAAWKLTVSG